MVIKAPAPVRVRPRPRPSVAPPPPPPPVYWVQQEQRVAVRVAWILMTTLGGGFGAFLACQLVPEAAFAENPIGNRGPHLLYFSGLIGLGMALPQLALLSLIVRGRRSRTLPLLLLWVPVTAGAWMIAILPLYEVYGGYLVIMPFVLLMLTLPGMLVLGAAQWWLLSLSASMPNTWAWRTTLGALGGVVGGLFLAVLLEGTALGAGGLESIWAATAGLTVALLQAPLLVTATRVRRDPLESI